MKRCLPGKFPKIGRLFFRISREGKSAYTILETSTLLRL